MGKEDKTLYKDAKKNLDKAKDSMKNIESTIEHKDNEWHIKDTVKEAAEDAKEYVGSAVNYVKGMVTKEEEEKKEQKSADKGKQVVEESSTKEENKNDEHEKTITEKIVGTLETGAEKVLSVFGLGNSSNKKESEEN